MRSNEFTANHEETRPLGIIANPTGNDGVTERTGESMRSLRIWIAKGPNLIMVNRSNVRGNMIWGGAVLQY